MTRIPSINEYSGLPHGLPQEVWQVDRIPARRYEMGNFYKPSMVRFEDGELLAVPYYQEDLGGIPQKVEYHLVFLSSRDDGRTWQEVGTRIQGGSEARLQILADGTLIMTCGFVSTSGSAFCRSYDRGRSWEIERITVEDMQPEAEYSLHSRNVLEMDDGSILLGVCSCFTCEEVRGVGLKAPEGCQFRNWFFRSTDSGRTWSEKIPLEVKYKNYKQPCGFRLFGEADLHRFASGRIILVARFNSLYPKQGWPILPGSEGGTHLRIFALEDDGVTWIEEREFLDYHNVHHELLELSDGRLLCSYGARHFPFGTQAVISHDEGRTWSEDHPILLSWFSWDSSMGFPSSVEMPDGTILTAYTTHRYRGLEKWEDEMFCELVRWQLPPKADTVSWKGQNMEAIRSAGGESLAETFAAKTTEALGRQDAYFESLQEPDNA